jgi:hypothetical protein
MEKPAEEDGFSYSQIDSRQEPFEVPSNSKVIPKI